MRDTVALDARKCDPARTVVFPALNGAVNREVHLFHRTESAMRRRFGSWVEIEYEGSSSSGEVFDKSVPGEPLRVVLGDSMVPRGLERALFDMEVGQEATVELEPDEGFGAYQPEARFEVPLTMLPEWRALPVGEYIEWFGKGNERPAIAKVVEVGDGRAVIDLNHPLAGKTVSYRVKVVSDADC